jgi:hypothetical protein
VLAQAGIDNGNKSMVCMTDGRGRRPQVRPQVSGIPSPLVSLEGRSRVRHDKDLIWTSPQTRGGESNGRLQADGRWVDEATLQYSVPTRYRQARGGIW